MLGQISKRTIKRLKMVNPEIGNRGINRFLVELEILTESFKAWFSFITLMNQEISVLGCAQMVFGRIAPYHFHFAEEASL